MKITFIRPNMNANKAADALQPLVFALLKALTPLNVETAFYDDRIEDVPFDAPTDVVALTVETFAAQRAYWIAERYHERGVPVVMGGFHPTLVPEEARQYADSVILGDAEAVWPHVIDDAQRRRLQPMYQAPPLSLPLNATNLSGQSLSAAGTCAMGTRLFAFLRVLRHSRFLARARFNSPLSILKRACDLKTNMRSLFRLATFLRYAPLFRKEVYKKQDMQLGVNDGFIFSRRDAETQGRRDRVSQAISASLREHEKK